jgi:hypothetical protein
MNQKRIVSWLILGVAAIAVIAGAVSFWRQSTPQTAPAATEAARQAAGVEIPPSQTVSAASGLAPAAAAAAAVPSGNAPRGSDSAPAPAAAAPAEYQPPVERVAAVESLRQTLPSASLQNAQGAAEAMQSLQHTQDHASTAQPSRPPQADNGAIESLRQTIPPASAPVPTIPGSPSSLTGAGPVPQP